MMPDSFSRDAPTGRLPRRAAATLIEVIGTLSVLFVLGVSAASILGAITDIGTRNQRAKQGRLSVQRLASLFRLDVHQASNVVLTDNDWPLELSSEANSIRYEWDARSKSIRRTTSEGEQQLAVDRFQLSESCDPRITLSDEIVTLVLQERERTQPWIIEAIRP